MSVTAANFPCGGFGTSKGRLGSLCAGSGAVFPLVYVNQLPAPLRSIFQFASVPDSKSSQALDAGVGFIVSIELVLDVAGVLSSLRRESIVAVTSFRRPGASAGS